MLLYTCETFLLVSKMLLQICESFKLVTKHLVLNKNCLPVGFIPLL